MDYTTAPGYVTDATGRRQFADQVPGQTDGTSLVADDRNQDRNALMYCLEQVDIDPDAEDDTQVWQMLNKAVEAIAVPANAQADQNRQSYYTPAPSSSETTSNVVTLTFTAPHAGRILAMCHFNVSNLQPSQCQAILSISGSSVSGAPSSAVWGDTTVLTMSGSGVMPVNKGDVVTMSATYNVPPSTAQFASVGQTLTFDFQPGAF